MMPSWQLWLTIGCAVVIFTVAYSMAEHDQLNGWKGIIPAFAIGLALLTAYEIGRDDERSRWERRSLSEGRRRVRR